MTVHVEVLLNRQMSVGCCNLSLMWTSTQDSLYRTFINLHLLGKRQFKDNPYAWLYFVSINRISFALNGQMRMICSTFLTLHILLEAQYIVE